MLALPGILALITFVYLRPQEVSASLRTLPFLHLFLLVALVGFAADVGMKKLRPRATPQLRWAVLFFLWTLGTIALRVPSAAMTSQIALIAIPLILFAVIGHSIQTFRAFAMVCGVVVVIVLTLAAIGVHQGYAPRGCVELAPGASEHLGEGRFNGRSCETMEECYGEDAPPENRYICERIGVLGTTTIMGRVRYRGVLQDPNELALAVSIGLPFLFAFASRRRKYLWKLLMVGGTAVVLVCVIKTSSRSGQLAFLGVLAVYMIKRYGVKGIAAGLVLAMPLLLLGGRSGGTTGQSTIDRYEAWRASLQMIRSHPLGGVGEGMFTEYHHLTAHNSYLLAAAELGIVGFLLWSVLLLASVKIALAGVGMRGDDAVAQDARRWGTALLASLVGLLISMMFLSLTYHLVLWIYLGIAGAFYSALKQARPDWTVRVTAGDVARVLAADVAILFAVAVILRVKGY